MALATWQKNLVMIAHVKYLRIIFTKMRNKNKILLIALLLVCNSYLLFSQGKTTLYGFIHERDSFPLIGTIVQLKGTNIGSISGPEGKYSLKIPDSLSRFTIIYSFLGYKTKEFEFIRDNYDKKKFVIKISKDVKN
ncbi:MAG TPA: carboxypeptidase-like regulatory domain-containing protein [Bacteroidales bacterium]